ncbi:hypothetical protein M5K25_005415 [Dendrobium thyrsiflorum]|uniref:Reverse transcriptase zinc-binding domain-containing protein n=1 Tax=Dendrobium thyrsiflorum TaxID=117978 RepID=A0ABD0VHH8_DENTH
MFCPSIGSWNIRGFNTSDKILAAKNLVAHEKLDMICLLENRILPENMSDPWFCSSHRVFDNEVSYHNFDQASPGRIWIKWDPEKISLSPLHSSKQHVTGIISAHGLPPCLLSVIYDSNSFFERNALWDDLRSQDPGDSMPWIIFGDFNCCRYQSEKSGGNAIPTAKLAPFNEFIFDSKVTEIPSTGIFLTWYNQRTVNPILIRLDRRVQFLKYTITNTVAYWMRGALIPKSIIKAIGKICAKFLYFGGDHSNRLHFISWNNTCKPHAKGGLGIASLKATRHALNCAVITRFYNHQTPFSAWLRTRYSSPWKPPDLVDSALWKDICRTAISVKGNFKFINNDKSPASILWDHWCMGTTLSNLFPDLCCNSAAFLKWESVKDWSHNIAWILPNHINPAIANDLSSLLSLIPLFPNATSHVVWKDNIKCSYKDFYKDYFERDDTVDWHKLALLGGLKTVDNLARRNIHIPDPYCIFCRCDAENLNHLFFECSYSFSVLTKLIPFFHSFYLRPSLTQPLHYVGNLPVAKLDKQGLLLTLNAIVYHLWRERNNRRYGSTSACTITTANKVVKAIKYKLAHRKFSQFLEKWFNSE